MAQSICSCQAVVFVIKWLLMVAYLSWLEGWIHTPDVGGSTPLATTRSKEKQSQWLLFLLLYAIMSI